MAPEALGALDYLDIGASVGAAALGVEGLRGAGLGYGTFLPIGRSVGLAQSRRRTRL